MSGPPVNRDPQAGGIRAWILDYGEVLCRRPAPAKIERMARIGGLEPEAFAVRYGAERGPYDRGDLSPLEYWSRVFRDTVVLGDGLIDTLRQWDVEMWSDVNRNMTDWLGALRAAGFKTALLSNMHPDMAVNARRSFEWLGHLDCVTLSCEVQQIKPDPQIYLRSVECLGLRPSETCFIDDREANVEGARAAGLMALQFRGVDSLRDDLARIGLTVLPRAESNQPAPEARNEWL